jgi:hypothetical protein
MLCASDDLGEKSGNGLNFCFCVLPSKGEADERIRVTWFETERNYDMGGLKGA